MSQIEIARRSIAFNSKVVDDLNNKLAKIDSRLYFFAYYEPTALPEDSDDRTVFYLAVLNMYGLLWDCGPMVRECILYRGSRMITRINATMLENCRQFCNIIDAVRTNICHNNSTKFYFNVQNKACADTYIRKAACDINGSLEVDWRALCLNFLKCCDDFVAMLNQFVKLGSSVVEHKEKVRAIWMSTIANWYKDEHLLLHILADKYDMKQRELFSKRPRSITKKLLKDWVRNSTIAEGDYYAEYLIKCHERVDKLLHSKNCPKPALPLECLHIATGDARHFATSPIFESDSCR